MAYQIGETRTLTFPDTSLLGSGVARDDGMAVFCPGAVAGDTAEVRITGVKRRYAEAQLVRLLTPSADRCPPDCAVFGQGGGCAFRHITCEAEARLKENAVRAALRRCGEIRWDPIFTAPPDGYRNKTVFHLDEHYRAGYYAAATNEFCRLPDGGCRLLPSLFRDIADATTQVLTEWKSGLPFRALAIRKNTDGEFTAVLHAAEISGDVRLAAGHWAERLTQRVPGAAGLFLAAGMPEERDVRYERLLGENCLTDTFLGLRLRISPAAFYQVNHDVAEALCTTVAKYAALQPGETAADLYCGTGTIGLTLSSLSPGASLTGIEINESAVRDAVTNAEQNKLESIRFRCGDSATAEREGLRFDCVVIDPPRKGCSPEMLAALTRLAPRRIVYVSCNPATLSRDAAALAEAGWHVVRAQPFDMFPRTGHVETVCLLSNLNTKQNIEIDLSMDELDLTDAEKKAAYQEIKDYVLEHSGLKVSSLYIAQVKQKCGIIERENYNKSKSEDAKQPQCPPDKEKAIREALKHFGMI